VNTNIVSRLVRLDVGINPGTRLLDGCSIIPARINTGTDQYRCSSSEQL